MKKRKKRKGYKQRFIELAKAVEVEWERYRDDSYYAKYKDMYEARLFDADLLAVFRTYRTKPNDLDRETYLRINRIYVDIAGQFTAENLGRTAILKARIWRYYKQFNRLDGHIDDLSDPYLEALDQAEMELNETVEVYTHGV